MSYKSLTTFVTSEPDLASLLEAGAAMAQDLDAHLEVCCLAVDTTQAVGAFGGAPVVIYQDSVEIQREQAEALRDKVRAVLDGRSIRWSTEDTVVPIGAIGSYVGLKARFSDLVILPCPYGGQRMSL